MKDCRTARSRGKLAEEWYKRAVFVSVLVNQDRDGAVSFERVQDSTHGLLSLDNLNSVPATVIVQHALDQLVPLSSHDEGDRYTAKRLERAHDFPVPEMAGKYDATSVFLEAIANALGRFIEYYPLASISCGQMRQFRETCGDASPVAINPGHQCLHAGCRQGCEGDAYVRFRDVPSNSSKISNLS